VKSIAEHKIYRELEGIVRNITTDHFGPVKTEKSLSAALEKLGRLDDARGISGLAIFTSSCVCT